jgi:hypothetical protein
VKNVTKRCVHGYAVHLQLCPECDPSRLERKDPCWLNHTLTVSCVLCEGMGHVAKLCPQTAVGRERAR